MSVSLGRDGTVTVTEDAGKAIKTRFGHWADTGSQIKVTFDAVTGQPSERPMVFESNHDELRAITWDHAIWGNVTPPSMKKEPKIKQSYWFTTVQ